MFRSRSPLNIGELFDWHADAGRQTVMHLDRPFDIAPDGGVCYDAVDLARTVREISGWLAEAGLRHGDRLAIIKDNHYDIFMVAAAAARIGALPAMIAPLHSCEAIRTMIERLAPSVLVVSASVLDRARESGIALAGPGVRLVVLGDPGNGFPDGAITLADARGAEAPGCRLRPADQPMLVTHSSGTTGVPKLVVHTGQTILGGGSRMELIRFPVVASRLDDVVASSIAFAHARIVSWTAGQFALTPRKLVIISDHGLDHAAEIMAQHPPTTLEACPNIFQRWEELADNRPELFHQVRLFAGTFDAVHPRTVRKFLGASRRRVPIWGQSWGQSEVGPVCIALFTRRRIRKVSSDHAVTNDIGWSVPGLARVRVVDSESGRSVPRGKPGILMVATKARCAGYLGEQDRHDEKTTGKWWNTGDIGERGRFGRLRLVDREVDVIPGTSGIELESILLDRLERAAEVTVLGVPGQLPVPVLCMRENQLDPAEWQRAVEGLPELAAPHLVPWEEVPRTATWKVRRLELREQVLGSQEVIGTGRWT